MTSLNKSIGLTKLKLNKEQQQARDHVFGPCIVTAIPGSGKTRALTERVIHLTKDKDVSPRNILCTTFTNKAAKEMKERIAHSIGVKSKEIFINTFHGVCLSILRKYANLAHLVNPFSIYNEKDQIELMSKIARMHEYDYKEWRIKQVARKCNDYREDVLNTDKVLDEVEDEDKFLIDNYITYIRELNAVDFSGILSECYNLLVKNPKVVDVLSDRFKFVMIDEAQDMNSVQYEISKLVGKHGNLFWVADYNQSIFSWRGARPDNLYNVKNDFPDVKEITITKNYRSTTQILNAASNLIKHNKEGNVDLVSAKGDGPPVRINNVFDVSQEKQLLSSRIMQLKDKGLNWKDMAVLYRVNSYSNYPESALRTQGIPYKIIGGFSFFDRKEIKAVLAYLRLIANPHDTIAFSRAVTEPKRGIGNVNIGRIENVCRETGKSIVEVTASEAGLKGKTGDQFTDFVSVIAKYRKKEQEQLKMAEIAAGVVLDSGFAQYVNELSKNDRSDEKRAENVAQLITDIAEFQTKKPTGRLGDYLQAIQVFATEEESRDDAVSLLTMHSSKGLEFRAVFIVGAEEGVIPHKFAEAENRIDEERRLMYVGMTRAKDILCITRCSCRQDFRKNKGRPSYTRPSRFLYEIDPDFDEGV